MPKVNNLRVRSVLVRKCRIAKLAFNRFKNAVNNLRIFDADEEALIKLTLDNLLNEIGTATDALEGKYRK